MLKKQRNKMLQQAMQRLEAVKNHPALVFKYHVQNELTLISMMLKEVWANSKQNKVKNYD